jgi:hypothetical protein
MKNVNLIEANKPSRLKKDNSGKLILLDNGLDSPSYTPMNIYITSSEEIKEGVNQWYLDKFLNKPKNSSGSQYGEKQDVIILTNDRDLIRDNIEPIDDTFLQWFVKNPSCEKVEVEKEKIILGEVAGTTYIDFNYKIIIPKEEPKPTIKQVDYVAKKQERSYSEEDMKKAFQSSSHTNMLDIYNSFEDFIEQFKKK